MRSLLPGPSTASHDVTPPPPARHARSVRLGCSAHDQLDAVGENSGHEAERSVKNQREAATLLYDAQVRPCTFGEIRVRQSRLELTLRPSIVGSHCAQDVGCDDEARGFGQSRFQRSLLNPGKASAAQFRSVAPPASNRGRCLYQQRQLSTTGQTWPQ